MTARPGEQRRLASFERLDLKRLQIQPLLQVVDFFSSYAPTLALDGFYLVFA